MSIHARAGQSLVLLVFFFFKMLAQWEDTANNMHTYDMFFCIFKWVYIRVYDTVHVPILIYRKRVVTTYHYHFLD